MDVLSTVLESLREELRHHPAYGETQIIVLAHTERVSSTVIEAKVLAKDRQPQHIFIKLYKPAGALSEALQERLAREYRVLCDVYAASRTQEALSVVKPLMCLHKCLAFVTERSSGDTLQRVLVTRARWVPAISTRAELVQACNSCGRWLAHFQQLMRVNDRSRSHSNALLDTIEAHLRRWRANSSQAFDHKFQSRVMRYLATHAQNTCATEVEVAGVHGDFFPGNVLVEAQRITVLDFEMFRYGPIYADVAYFWYQLQTLALKPMYSHEMIAVLQRAFLAGYQAVTNKGDSPDNHPVFTLCLVKLALSRLADLAERQNALSLRRLYDVWAAKLCRDFLEKDLLNRRC